MKKYIFLIVIIVITFGYGILVGKTEIFPFDAIRHVKHIIVPEKKIDLNTEFSAYYKNQLNLYKMYKGNSIPKIVMLGDSITFRCDWDELLKRNDVINRGINSDTTYGMIYRLDLINPDSIQKVFIMAGNNDITMYNEKAEDVFTRYIEIINFFKKKHIKPYIQSTLYMSELTITHKKWNTETAKLNMLLQAFAKKNGIHFIDLNAKLSKNYSLINNYSTDGAHLNAKGYQIWRDVLKEYIN